MWKTFWEWLRGKGRKSLEQQATVRSAYSVGEGSENQKAARNVCSEDHADEVSDGMENSLGNWSIGHPCFLVAESLASLCPCPEASWKTELPSGQPVYLAEKIAKQQSVQAAAWLLLMAYSQMREQRDHLKRKLRKKKREQRSQRRSHQDRKGKGFSEQPGAKKVKADKERLPVLNPGTKKDSSRGLQKRAAKLPGNSSLLAKTSQTSAVIPRDLDAASASSRPGQHHRCAGASKGTKKVAVESRLSPQPKRKSSDTRKKTGFRLESQRKEFEAVMPHGAVGIKPKKKKEPSL